MAERFSEWLEAINYSPKTRVNYTRDVKLFLAWLIDNTSINSIVEVTPAHLRRRINRFLRHNRPRVDLDPGAEFLPRFENA